MTASVRQELKHMSRHKMYIKLYYCLNIYIRLAMHLRLELILIMPVDANSIVFTSSPMLIIR